MAISRIHTPGREFPISWLLSGIGIFSLLPSPIGAAGRITSRRCTWKVAIFVADLLSRTAALATAPLIRAVEPTLP